MSHQQILPSTSGAVEHAVVGRYRFPLLSHPVLRAQAAQERDVAAGVGTAMQDLVLYERLAAYVDLMLAEGRACVTEADIEALLLLEGGGDDASGASDPTAATPRAGQPGNFDRQLSICTQDGTHITQDNGSGAAPSLSRPCRQPQGERRRPDPRFARGAQWRATEARAYRLKPIVTEQTYRGMIRYAGGGPTEEGHQQHQHQQQQHPRWDPEVTHNSRVLADVAGPGVVSMADFETPSLRRSGVNSTSNGPGASAKPPNRPAPTRQPPPPPARDAVRTAVYSMLRQRLATEDAAVYIAAIERARTRQAALDARQLHGLSGQAFASLDMGMDGNTTCISQRRKAASVSPTQLTNIMIAQGQLATGGLAATATTGASRARQAELSRRGRRVTAAKRRQQQQQQSGETGAETGPQSSSQGALWEMDPGDEPGAGRQYLPAGPFATQAATAGGGGGGPSHSGSCLGSAAQQRDSPLPVRRQTAASVQQQLAGPGSVAQGLKHMAWERALQSVRDTSF